MAAEWLRAGQVAAIAARWQGPHDAHSPYWPQITDVDQLLAQDGRWRALVGELWEACQARDARAPFWTPAEDTRYRRALAQVQAALDGGG